MNRRVSYSRPRPSKKAPYRPDHPQTPGRNRYAQRSNPVQWTSQPSYPYPQKPQARETRPHRRNAKYQALESSLGGDPYAEYKQRPDWIKWIVPGISLLVFLICVIVLITLLT